MGRFILLSIAMLLMLTVSVAQAGSRDQPPPLSGWTHSPKFPDDTRQQHGVVLQGKDIVRSSPVIADIDGNSTNGKEVAVGGVDGILYVYKSNGQLLWSKNVLPQSCTARGDKINSGPAVGRIYGDGIPYIVVSYGPVGSGDCDGGIATYDGRNGTLKWRFSLREWARKQGYTEGVYGMISSPALADTDGDGRMEIGFGGLDRNVYLLNADGTVRWYYHAADTVWSSPAFVNIDSDPELELVIGTDIMGNPNLNPRTYDGGYVYAFDTQPRTPSRIEFQTGYKWRTHFNQVIYSSPVIGDVLPNNSGPEIVIGSGCYYPRNVSQLGDKYGKWIKILRLSDGAVLQTLNANACIQSSAALGDLDDDGVLEIVATVNSPTFIDTDATC
jgi:hypothetical protein